jgi:colanic acid biosynthesis glycosyl transferase WcaI
LNVLIVSQYFWPETFRINDLAIGLRERGHSVTVLAGTPNYPEGRFYPGYGLLRKRVEDFEGIRVLRVPQIPRGSGRRIQLAANYLSYAFTASALGPLLCNRPVDVILVFQMSPATVGLPALVLKAIKRAPILFWVQDLWPESVSAAGNVHSPAVLKPLEWMLRLIYRYSDRILMQSRAFSEPIQRLGGLPERLGYLPNTAESFYRPCDPTPENARRIGAPESGFRVMYAGNIGATQDFPTIIAAADRLRDHPEIHWVILGDGRMRPWVEQEVERLGLRGTVHLLGRFPVEEMPGLLALGDAVLATLKREAIFALTIPSKVQSYLACGLPIVAALEGEGARVIEEARAGISCPPENPDALADAVLQMSRLSKAERAAMGSRGRHYFDEHFERERLLDRLERWVHEITGGRAK